MIGNVDAWIPLTDADLPIRSTEQTRAGQSPADRAANYIAVAKQLNVGMNPRYLRGHATPGPNGPGRETYCNIFLCDVMFGMGVVLPHWMDPATGVPVGVGKGVETSANGVCTWMFQHGLSFHWMEIDQTKARARATDGFPTCVLWLNPGGIGHVAVILPGMDFTHIAQSGGSNFFDGPIAKGFGAIPNLRFFTHD